MRASSNRREFLKKIGISAGGLGLGVPLLGRQTNNDAGKPQLELATFRVEASPPLGHPLCGGAVRAAEEIVDPLYALGVVFLSNEKPVVLCAVDWTGICNEADVIFREQLARAVGTAADRVAIHCGHQHDALIVDPTAERLLAKHAGPKTVDLDFFNRFIKRTATVVQEALGKVRPVTHIGLGEAKVEKVASTRRIMGTDGKVRAVRYSASSPPLTDEPEGLIDPWLKTVSFWEGDCKLAALHYYATHPQSYYGKGGVSSDFVGMARERRAKENAPAEHIYFTGAAGNIAAGKYNDGSPKNRPILAERIYQAMVESEKKAERLRVSEFHWRSMPVVLPPRADATEDHLETLVKESTPNNKIKSAMWLSYLRRAAAKIPFMLSALHLGKVCLLHLPAEAFVEFQLFAQKQRPGSFVATAAYGDCGPWYIPPEKCFEEGGFEPTWAFASPKSEEILQEAIAKLLKA